MYNKLYRVLLREKEIFLLNVQKKLKLIASITKLSFSFSTAEYSVLVTPYGVSYFAVVGNELIYVSPSFIPFETRINLFLELIEEIKDLFDGIY